MSTQTGTTNRFGKIRRWVSVGAVVEDVRAPAGLRLAGHGHDEPHLCLLVQGGFRERDRRRSRAVGPGTIRISAAGDQHDLAFTRGSRCLVILVQPPLATDLPRFRDLRMFLHDRGVAALLRRLVVELERPAHAASPLAIETLILELLARGGQPSGRARRTHTPPVWLQRVRETVAHAGSQPIDVGALARVAGRHPVYVARAFRQWYGMGVADFARTVRIERARRQLLQSDWSLARIAAETGYADQSHLTRSLRRRLGMTPAMLRRRGQSFIEVASVQDWPDPLSHPVV